MTATMLYIFDGSGPSDDAEYASRMRGSFCSQIRNLTISNCEYYRGPHSISNHIAIQEGWKYTGPSQQLSLQYEVSDYLYFVEKNPALFAGPASVFGNLTIRSDVKDRANSTINKIRTLPEDTRIFLCGYSRGGATAIQVSQGLPDRQIEAMFLFDAVDRDLLIEAETIPNNVKNVYHAVRNDKFAHNSLKSLMASYFEMYLSGFDLSDKLEIMKRSARHAHIVFASRSYFGNCGTKWNSYFTNYVRRYFMGTHGALGGVPWDDIPTDRGTAQQVHNWMWPHFRAHQLLRG